MSDIDVKEYQLQDEQKGKPDQKKKPKKKKIGIKKAKSRTKKSAQFVSSTYRKQKCEFYNKGSCSKGETCTYSHDFEPEAAKKICKFFLSGSCSKDVVCPYSHNTKIYPCRFYHIDGYCQMMDSCRFSHQKISQESYQEYMNTNKQHILKLYKEGRLTNTNLLDFIEEEVPKKDITPPPLIIQQISPNRKPLPKKDPRQRITCISGASHKHSCLCCFKSGKIIAQNKLKQSLKPR